MDPGPVKIFTFRDVPRLRYIAEIILGEILGLSWEIITDKRKLGKNPVINYSGEDINGSLKIQPHNLLFETGLKNHEPSVSEWKGLPVFFQTPEGSDLPFDIFAASFFLISRYEEYLSFEPDRFGRFSASQSFAYKNKFLSRPVIDLWTKELAKTLLTRFQNIAFKRNNFGSLLTIDIDQPFAYLGKDIFRSLGGIELLPEGKKIPTMFSNIYLKPLKNINPMYVFSFQPAIILHSIKIRHGRMKNISN
jgi:hypothetical protein